MDSYQNLLSLPPFQLDRREKRSVLLESLRTLGKHHYENCEEYKKILDTLNIDIKKIEKIEDVPFIPVSLFKKFDLRSISQSDIFKTMTSSGTTGQSVSKIFLDKETASNQQKTLVKIVSNFTGSSRMPMLVIDSPSVIKDRKMFSARGAGILGFSIFGSDITHALDDSMKINFELIENFLKKHKGKDIFLFGFTFVIWQYLYKELKRQNKHIDLSRGVLIHGGGWKKLADEAVSSGNFKEEIQRVAGLKRVHDYYGMIEQTGCIYMECEEGFLHASNFSDIIIRHPKNFSVCREGESGLVQLLSLLPKSYPGHSILSEDEGVVLGEDSCSCGRKGKFFKVLGRIKNAEIRGCSDTYEQH